MKVTVIGAGGLGIPASLALVQGWPADKAQLELLILDPDVIELSNLNRQFCFTEELKLNI